jgi:hypothetical protein
MVSDTPVLVSKSEVSWLRGELKLAKSYERRLRFNIKHKVKALAKVELPLLADKGFFYNDIDVSANCNGVTILSPFLKRGKPWMGFGPYFLFLWLEILQVSKLFNIYFFGGEGIPSVLFDKFFQ